MWLCSARAHVHVAFWRRTHPHIGRHNGQPPAHPQPKETTPVAIVQRQIGHVAVFSCSAGSGAAPCESSSGGAAAAATSVRLSALRAPRGPRGAFRHAEACAMQRRLAGLGAYQRRHFAAGLVLVSKVGRLWIFLYEAKTMGVWTEGPTTAPGTCKEAEQACRDTSQHSSGFLLGGKNEHLRPTCKGFRLPQVWGGAALTTTGWLPPVRGDGS